MKNWKWYNYAIVVAIVLIVCGLVWLPLGCIGFILAAAACGAGAGDHCGPGGA